MSEGLFSDLTGAECEFLRSIGVTFAGSKLSHAPGSSIARSQAAPRLTVRGKLLTVLLGSDVARAAAGLEDFNFVALNIVDSVDYRHGAIGRPLRFLNCVFHEPLSLRSCQIRDLEIDSCTVPGIDLRGMELSGDLVISRSNILGCLLLDNASLKGALTVTGSTIEPFGDIALSGRLLNVRGDVKFDDFRVAHGRVNLSHARLNGSLVMSRATILNWYCIALDAEDLQLEGSLLLSPQFRCSGQLKLVGARIRGGVVLSGGKLSHPSGIGQLQGAAGDDACGLYADLLRVDGDVFLDDAFECQGEVRLLGASIAGDLTCSGGKFEAFKPSDDAISATSSEIKKNCFLDGGFEAVGRLNFFGVVVGGIVRLQDAKIALRLGSTAVDFDHAEAGALQLRACDISGSVVLTRAVLGTLALGRSSDGRGTMTLDLREARCRLLKDESDSWPGYAGYDLTGFRYESLYLSDGWTLERCLEWLRRSDGGRFSPQPYEHLAGIQRNLGLSEDAREVLIERERRRPEEWHRTSSSQRWYFSIPRRITHTLFGTLVKFGYRPALALGWAAALWLVGALLIWYADQTDGFFPAKSRLHLEATSLPIPPTPVAYPSLNPFTYSLEVMVPFLKMNQEEFWLPNRVSQSGRVIQSYLWLHACLGWLLATFGVAAVSGIVKRD